VGRLVKFRLVFASIVIPSFDLLEIHNQDFYYFLYTRSRDNAVGIPTGYGSHRNPWPYFCFLYFPKKSKSKLCYVRRSVGQSVLVSSTHLGLKIRFFCLIFAGLLMRSALLGEEGGSLFHNVQCTTYFAFYILLHEYIYTIYIQRFCQSRLRTADHALSLVASAYGF
jgi:hypothetical protein